MSNNTETYVIRLNDVHFMAGMRRAQTGQTARRVSGIGGAMKSGELWPFLFML
jgi:hypothetical protein